MRRSFIAALILIGISSPAALAAPVQHERSEPAQGERPYRESALLKALPVRAALRADLRAAAQRARERRQARQEARAAAQAAAAAEAAAAAPTPSAVAPSTDSAGGGYLSDAQLASLLRGAGFPESAIPQMLYYAGRESGGCPTAVNGLLGCPSYGAAVAALADGSACGIWQMYECPGPQALDPATNAAMAYAKYKAGGFSPWGG